MASDVSVEPGDEEVATAVGRYVLGEISLGQAAEQIGMTCWEFEELLHEVGFTALYGPRTMDQLVEELDVVSDADE